MNWISFVQSNLYKSPDRTILLSVSEKLGTDVVGSWTRLCRYIITTLLLRGVGRPCLSRQMGLRSLAQYPRIFQSGLQHVPGLRSNKKIGRRAKYEAYLRDLPSDLETSWQPKYNVSESSPGKVCPMIEDSRLVGNCPPISPVESQRTFNLSPWFWNDNCTPFYHLQPL